MVVDGMVGTRDNPQSFYIHNPLTSTESFSVQSLNGYLSAYDNAINMVVVVDL